MEKYNKEEIKDIAKELFEVCYDKGIYLTLGVNAVMVICVIGDICYLSYLDQIVLNSRSELKEENRTLPIRELLEIAKQYNNEK